MKYNLLLFLFGIGCSLFSCSGVGSHQESSYIELIGSSNSTPNSQSILVIFDTTIAMEIPISKEQVSVSKFLGKDLRLTTIFKNGEKNTAIYRDKVLLCELSENISEYQTCNTFNNDFALLKKTTDFEGDTSKSAGGFFIVNYESCLVVDLISTKEDSLIISHPLKTRYVFDILEGEPIDPKTYLYVPTLFDLSSKTKHSIDTIITSDFPIRDTMVIFGGAQWLNSNTLLINYNRILDNGNVQFTLYSINAPTKEKSIFRQFEIPESIAIDLQDFFVFKDKLYLLTSDILYRVKDTSTLMPIFKSEEFRLEAIRVKDDNNNIGLGPSEQ